MACCCKISPSISAPSPLVLFGPSGAVSAGTPLVQTVAPVVQPPPERNAFPWWLVILFAALWLSSDNN